MKCNHINKMYPVRDIWGWVVGELCDCGYFIPRKGIPDYDGRSRLNKDEARK